MRTARLLVIFTLLAGCGEQRTTSPEPDEPTPSDLDRTDPMQPRSAEGDAIEFTLTFPNATSHYVEVTAVYPTEGLAQPELMMAVWTPGSYLVREFARHVEGLVVSTLDGEVLAVEKVRKNRWRVDAQGARQIVARYRLYCRELSVRTNFVDRDMAVLNGASTFLTLVDRLDRAHDVRLEVPEQWERSLTQLQSVDGESHHYRAENYDILVDSPILIGNPSVHEFEVEGTPHVLANFGEAGVWDGPRSAEDARKIVEAQIAFWGSIPYNRYIFFNVLSAAGGGGGLEHLASTLLIEDVWATHEPDDYRGWLGLVSHEFFHTWNVKRLRPVALGPFDYENEVYTRDLWIAEGFTSYYDDLFVARAGLMTQEQYLGLLSQNFESVHQTPGRLLHPLAETSFDAWIKYYRHDENTQNTSVSYYRKGALVGFLLDAEIQRRTNGAKSLDDVMRLAYERYSGERGYTSEEFRAVVDEVAGESLAEFFGHAVDRAEELDYEPALEWYGLQFADDQTGGQDEEEPTAYLGVETREDDGRVLVTRVVRDSPAQRFGVNVDDEIIAIDGFRVNQLAALVSRFQAEQSVALLVSRRGTVRELEVTLGAKPAESWTLEVRDDATTQQRRRFEALLSRDGSGGD